MSLPLLFGPYGSTRLPGHVKDFGVNAVWFHGFDEDAFLACRQLDLHACVEFKTFRADFRTRPELIPIGTDGKPIRYGELVQGVCLSQTSFLLEIEDHLLEGLKTYKPRGIWLDYLTYAGWFETPVPDLQDSCFCRECIRDFCEQAGVDAEDPAEILTRYAEEWEAHKCAKVARLACHYAGLIRERLPDCVIGAYMCPWEPNEFDGALTGIFAQSYELLAPAIDIFTPLIYCTKSGRDGKWGKNLLDASSGFVPSGRKVQLILDYLDYPDSLLPVASGETVSWGIQMFGGAPLFHNPEQARQFQAAVEAIRKSVRAVS